MEGKLVAELVEKMAVKDGASPTETQRLRQSLDFLERIIDGLGFCLSEEGDLLSQWRGYAADATGISVGFSKSYLESLSQANTEKKQSGFTLQAVEYDEEAQMELVRPTYEKIKEKIDQGALKPPPVRTFLNTQTEKESEKEKTEFRRKHVELSLTITLLFKDLFLLKSKAFREEKEWRLVSFFVKTGKDTCNFRATNDRIVPYREFEMVPTGVSPIDQVFIGPKNGTPKYVMEKFLEQNGFKNVEVSLSEASYR